MDCPALLVRGIETKKPQVSPGFLVFLGFLSICTRLGSNQQPLPSEGKTQNANYPCFIGLSAFCLIRCCTPVTFFKFLGLKEQTPLGAPVGPIPLVRGATRYPQATRLSVLVEHFVKSQNFLTVFSIARWQ